MIKIIRYSDFVSIKLWICNDQGWVEYIKEDYDVVLQQSIVSFMAPLLESNLNLNYAIVKPVLIRP